MAEINKMSTPISEAEVSLLKKYFKGNEYTLKLVRTLFFGFNLTQEEKEIVKKTFANKELLDAFKKKTFPTFIRPDMPIGQVSDFWSGTESQISGMPKEVIYQTVFSKQTVLEMLLKAFALLENPDGEKVNLDYNPRLILNDDMQIFLLARLLYIRTVEYGLSLIKLVVENEETPAAEVKKAQKMNSNK